MKMRKGVGVAVLRLRRPFNGLVVVTQGYANAAPFEPYCFLGSNRDIDFHGGVPTPVAGHWHNGVDYGLALGTELVAPADGVVVLAGISPTGFGLRLVIRHAPGICSLLGHMSTVDFAVGAHVAAGATVGTSGGGNNDARDGNSSGAHLHWSVLTLERGVYHDPAKFL